MNVVDPNNTAHNIFIIPRNYDIDTPVLNLYNEATRLAEDVDFEFSITDGKMSIVFDFTFLENDRFRVKISEGNEIYYRGKLFATSQPPQEYKLTNNVYYY
jgi:hypothetical protein